MFLDANVFIHAHDGIGTHGRASMALLQDISKGSQRAKTSWLVVNEVIHYCSRTGRLDMALRHLEMVREMPNLKILAIDASVASHVAHFLRSGLATSDAFHAATMRANRIDVICSFDKGFDKIEGIRRVEPK